MTFLRIILPILVCLLLVEAKAQDRLLLTNGKIRKLKGTVVYFDHEEVLYQNDKQRKRMKAYVAKTEAKSNARLSSKSYEQKKRKTEESEAKKLKEKELKLAQRKADFETDVKIKLEQLSPADFEKWKIRELDRIKTLEKKHDLDMALEEQTQNLRAQRKESRKRAKFTKRIARDLVFSILKPDSTEIVVYNADTLGFFADGEAEVDYGITDMRAYIAGRQAGRKHNTSFDMVLGVGVGVISAAVGSFWGPSIPAGTVIFTSIANVKIKNKAGIDSGLLDNPAFKDGYDRSAKKKKAWNFVKGSIAGLSFGLLVGDGLFRNQLIPAPR